MKKFLCVLASAAALLGGACDRDAEPSPTRTAIPSARPTVFTRGVPGLFSDPRVTTPDEYRALAPPPVTFPPWDGQSTVVYDIEAGTMRNLGPGTKGTFNADSSRFAWIGNPDTNGVGEVRVLDLRSGEVRPYGPGVGVRFLDDTTLAVNAADGTSAMIDLATEARTDPAPTPTSVHPLPVEIQNRRGTAGALVIVGDADGTERRLEIDRGVASTADDHTLFVVLPTDPGTPPSGYTSSVGNLFLVDLDAPGATFVATASFSYGGADDRFVVWVDDYCSNARGNVRVYNRATGKISELDTTRVPSLGPAHHLILGGDFQTWEVIDLDTLTRLAVVPGGEISWSQDGRYASTGWAGGRGGWCI